MIGKAKDKNNVTHHIVNYFYDHEGKLRHKEVRGLSQTPLPA
jgi:hypothetical protein